jgi:hypothetical protein
MSTITTAMQSALDYIRQEGGGAVDRLEGGFWMKPRAKFSSGCAYVKTATINALEKRGLVEIAYPNNRPRATLTAAGIKASNWTPVQGEDSPACGVEGRTP